MVSRRFKNSRSREKPAATAGAPPSAGLAASFPLSSSTSRLSVSRSRLSSVTAAVPVSCACVSAALCGSAGAALDDAWFPDDAVGDCDDVTIFGCDDARGRAGSCDACSATASSPRSIGPD